MQPSSKEAESKLCFSAFVFGDYARYIPFYCYSVLRSYPHAGVKLFVQGKLSLRQWQCVELIRKKISPRVQVIEGYFSDKVVKDPKLLRWLVPADEFPEYEWIYFGDVDFLIVRESPTLLSAHIEHCRSRNLPFSNEIRIGSDRLTGLHFVEKEAYYREMESVIADYRDSPPRLKDAGERFSNEQFLLHLVRRKFEVVEAPEGEYFRPNHGFHLGCARCEKTLGRYMELYDEAHESVPPLSSIRNQVANYCSDPIFKKMIRWAPIFELGRAVQVLQIPGADVVAEKISRASRPRLTMDKVGATVAECYWVPARALVRILRRLGLKPDPGAE